MLNIRVLRIGLLAFGLSVSPLSGYSGAASAQTAKSDDISALLAQLRKVLVAVQGEISAKKLPALKSVQLNLQTGMKRDVDGSVGIFIFTVGASASDQTVQTLNITLTPPPAPSALAPAGSTVPDFNKEFAQAIISAAESVAVALKSGAEPKLVLGSLEASINFTYENVVQGGINTAKLLPITLELTGKVTPSAAQKVVLTFGKA
jgi:hypothetical protein